MNLDNEKDGLIKQLVYLDTSALKKEEIEMFNYLLDESYVVKMSQAFLQDGKAKVYHGPLKHFEKNIVKVDKYNQGSIPKFIFYESKDKSWIENNKQESSWGEWFTAPSHYFEHTSFLG